MIGSAVALRAFRAAPSPREASDGDVTGGSGLTWRSATTQQEIRNPKFEILNKFEI